MSPARRALAAAAAAAIVLGARRADSESPPKAWRGWDAYHPIIWSTGDRPKARLAAWFEALKKLGFTAEQCPPGADASPFLANGFGFYVENLVPELTFLHSRKKLYDEDFDAYTKTQDRKHLVRRPCFDDPATLASLKGPLQEAVRPYVEKNPLAHDLRDELSIGSFASPMDYCFCPHTLAAFRNWLKDRYKTLAALDEEWETKHASWDEVSPLTTYEIKERETAALAAGKPENYAPWADHRAFMDESFARATFALRGFVREVDARTPVGIEGTQMPSAFGGFDLWRLSQAVDWVEPYDIGGSREVWGSFLPESEPVLATVFGDDFPRLRRRLFRNLLLGDRGCIVWDDEQSRCLDQEKPDFPETKRGKGFQPIFAELRALSPVLQKCKRQDDRIAIHYSQASVRAQWMIDSREDGKTWPRRFSSYEPSHSRLVRVRDAALRLVQDSGLQARFVSYAQIESGELEKGGYKVLVLPQSIAMSKEECRKVESFVKSGGTLVALGSPATMDEHGKRLARGQLDEIFRHAPGKGRAVLVERETGSYGKDRLSPPRGAELLEAFRKILEESGLEASVKVNGKDGSPLPCVRVLRWKDGDRDLIALMRNPELEVDSLKDAGYVDNSALEKTEPVTVVFPRKAQVGEVRSGKSFGATSTVSAELDPWSPLVFELR